MYPTSCSARIFIAFLQLVYILVHKSSLPTSACIKPPSWLIVQGSSQQLMRGGPLRPRSSVSTTQHPGQDPPSIPNGGEGFAELQLVKDLLSLMYTAPAQSVPKLVFSRDQS